MVLKICFCNSFPIDPRTLTFAPSAIAPGFHQMYRELGLALLLGFRLGLGIVLGLALKLNILVRIGV